MGEQLEILFPKEVTKEDIRQAIMKWQIEGANGWKIQIPPPQYIIFCGSSGSWLMRITPENRIEFNREEFPDLPIDKFAERVMNILEIMKMQLYPQSVSMSSR